MNDVITECVGGWKIRMLKDHYGSPDAFTVKLYKAKQAYVLSPSLAARFLKLGVAYNLEDDDAPDSGMSPVGDMLYQALKPLPNKAWGNFRPTARMGDE